MKLKQWYYRFTYLLNKRLAVKEGRWGANEATLRMLIEYLPKLAPNLEKNNDWKSVQVVSKWKTIDGFLQHIRYVTPIIERLGDVVEPSRLLAEPTTILLHDFFLTEQRLPLTLKEVVRTLHDTLSSFLNALEASKQKQEFRYGYYLRRYFHLIEAAYTFVQILTDLAARE